MVINLQNKEAMQVESKVYNFCTVITVSFQATDLWIEGSLCVVIYLDKYVVKGEIYRHKSTKYNGF